MVELIPCPRVPACHHLLLPDAHHGGGCAPLPGAALLASKPCSSLCAVTFSVTHTHTCICIHTTSTSCSRSHVSNALHPGLPGPFPSRALASLPALRSVCGSEDSIPTCTFRCGNQGTFPLHITFSPFLLLSLTVVFPHFVLSVYSPESHSPLLALFPPGVCTHVLRVSGLLHLSVLIPQGP